MKTSYLFISIVFGSYLSETSLILISLPKFSVINILFPFSLNFSITFLLDFSKLSAFSYQLSNESEFFS